MAAAPNSGAQVAGDDSDDEDLLGADFGKAAADAGNASDYENEDGGFSPRAVSPEPMSPAGGTPGRHPDAVLLPGGYPREGRTNPIIWTWLTRGRTGASWSAFARCRAAKKLGRFKAASGSGRHGGCHGARHVRRLQGGRAAAEGYVGRA